MACPKRKASAVKPVGEIFGNYRCSGQISPKLSGGQRQRVAAARALILNPKMFLADKPTGALDSKNARNIMEKLSGLNRDEQATILMVTHDSNAASFCKHILFIQDGIIFHELRRGDESSMSSMDVS